MASIYQTLSNVFGEIRLLVNKDSYTISDTNLLTMANKHYLWLIRELNQGEYVNGQISTTNLVNGQQEYPLPVDDTAGSGAVPYGGGYVQMLRVESALDGSNWKVLQKVDMMSQSLPANGNAPYDIYTVQNPAYALYDSSLWLYPTPTSNVTNGLKLYFVERPTELDATSDIPDLSKDFLPILSLFVRSDVLTILGRTQEAAEVKAEAYTLLERAKQLVDAKFLDFQVKPKKNVSNYK